jgi:hypothetical protein
VKFKNVSIHNLNELLPSWAVDVVPLARRLDEMLNEPNAFAPLGRPCDVYARLKFWVEVDATSEPAPVRICTKDDSVDLSGHLILTVNPAIGSKAQIVIPLNPVLKGHVPLKGKHVLYCHSFQTEVRLAYIGISKKPWYVRLGEHVSSARRGSPHLFHQAILKHQNLMVLHRVLLCELDYEEALRQEEAFVERYSLYPLGLNMIPGGSAGVRYLHRLGFKTTDAAEKSAVVEALSARDSIEGRPNPLCAARWAADQAFVERVICGHSGRLTAEQVRTVRLLASFGKTSDEITSLLPVRNTRQVSRVLREATYKRIR